MNALTTTSIREIVSEKLQTGSGGRLLHTCHENKLKIPFSFSEKQLKFLQSFPDCLHAQNKCSRKDS